MMMKAMQDYGSTSRFQWSMRKRDKTTRLPTNRYNQIKMIFARSAVTCYNLPWNEECKDE